jgi:hypothetical protein
MLRNQKLKLLLTSFITLSFNTVIFGTEEFVLVENAQPMATAELHVNTSDTTEGATGLTGAENAQASPTATTQIITPETQVIARDQESLNRGNSADSMVIEGVDNTKNNTNVDNLTLGEFAVMVNPPERKPTPPDSGTSTPIKSQVSDLKQVGSPLSQSSDNLTTSSSSISSGSSLNPLAQSQIASSILSASTVGSINKFATGLANILVKDDFKDDKLSPFGIEVDHIKGELPSLTSEIFMARDKKPAEGSNLIRFLNLDSDYPVVTLSFLAAFEAVVNHPINDRAHGRVKLNIRDKDDVLISHLFHRVIGTSESSMPAAFLYAKHERTAMQELIYAVHQGYLTYDVPIFESGIYSAQGRQNFLRANLASQTFENGVLRGKKLYITTYNTKTEQTEVFSNSEVFPQYRDVMISSVLEASTASPNRFNSQYIAIGMENGPFGDGIQGIDTAYSIYQMEKANDAKDLSEKACGEKTLYQIVSIGNDPHYVGQATDLQSCLKKMRQKTNQSLAKQFSVDVSDKLSPVHSFVSFLFKEDQLGKPDDFSPAHVIRWVQEGLQGMRSRAFEILVENLGYNMPPTEELGKIEEELLQQALFNLPSPIYKGLPETEQAWLNRSLAGETETLGFIIYSNLSYNGSRLNTKQLDDLLSAVTQSISKDKNPNKWCKLWSATDVSLKEAIHKGNIFSNEVKKLDPLTLEEINHQSEFACKRMLTNFKTILIQNEKVFGTKVDAFTNYFARIYVFHMLRDIKGLADPLVIRGFQTDCSTTAYSQKGYFGGSREHQMALEFGKILDEIYGSESPTKG